MKVCVGPNSCHNLYQPSWKNPTETSYINYHFYADDTQLYVSFDIDEVGEAVEIIEEAVTVPIVFFPHP